jgi:hypothetical protein
MSKKQPEKTGPKFAIVPKEVIKDSRLGDAAFRDFVAVCLYADKENRECFPKLSTIAGDRKSPQAVHASLQQAINLGYLKKENQRREDGSNMQCLYRVLTLKGDVDAVKGDTEGHPPPALSGPKRDVDANKKNNRPSEQTNVTVLSFPSDSHSGKTPEEPFEIWWQHVPVKISKGGARKAFKATLKKEPFEKLLTKIKEYTAQEKAKGTPKQYIKSPGNWLREEKYDDEVIPVDEGGAESPRTPLPNDFHESMDSPEWKISNEIAVPYLRREEEIDKFKSWAHGKNIMHNDWPGQWQKWLGRSEAVA